MELNIIVSEHYMEKYQSGLKEKPSFFQRIRKSGKTDTHLENGKNKEKNKIKSKEISKVDKIFASISEELPQYVIGQEDYLDSLVLAFKRSVLVDNNKSYKNFVIVTGPLGSGKKYSIQVLAKLLSITNIVKNSLIYTLDFSAYAEPNSVEKLFYPDMYRAFYSDAPVVIFDNFDMACEDVIKAISILGIEGCLKAHKRFGWDREGFQESTGSYSQGLSDYISANDKYIVMISDKDKERINNLFSTEFFSHVHDVLETNKLSDESLVEITNGMLADCYEKIESIAAVSIVRDDFSNHLIKVCDKDEGVHSIEKIIEYELYKPLIDLCLKKEITSGCSIHFTIDNSTDYLYANEYKLGKLSKKNNENLLLEAQHELDNLIGLESVKNFVKKLENNIRFQRKYNQDNQKKQSLHMIFSGNPGTGKTTVAWILGKYLKALGILSEGQMVEVSRSDLVGQYVGETAQKTTKKVRDSLGGILFIDEAYSLVRGKNDVFGLEAIDTLIKMMEDNRENFVVIAAGYTKEMQSFLESNSGLKSRFVYNVEFPDYSATDMLNISCILANKASYSLDENSLKALFEHYQKTQSIGKNDVGNGRYARNIIEKAIVNHSHRLSMLGEVDAKIIHTLQLDDFEFSISSFDLETELSKIIGLSNIKELIRNFSAQIQVEKKRRDAGFEVQTIQSLNMIFLGNPGTGKTYIARLMSKILKESGFLKSDIFIETDRSGLVAEYAGQTAQKTREIFETAIGGVLFIDEAYSLSAQNAFDKEAIDTLVKLIEDNAGNIVVILAGYKKEMNEFLGSNVGLESRFPLIMEFPDYSSDELYPKIRTIVTQNLRFENTKPGQEQAVPFDGLCSPASSAYG